MIGTPIAVVKFAPGWLNKQKNYDWLLRSPKYFLKIALYEVQWRI